MPDADTLEAPAPAEKPSERAGFRLAVFGALLVVVLFAGYGIGRLNEGVERSAAATNQGASAAEVGGVEDGHGHGAEPGEAVQGGTTGGGQPGAGQSGVAPHDDTGTAPHVHNVDGSVTPVGAGAAGESVGGLSVTSQGLTMAAEKTTFPAGRATPLKFKITGAAGAPVTTYLVVHDKPLHLIVVRRDLSGFQHLHPTMAPDGTWSIPLALDQPGSYRAIADFTALVGGRQVPVTLGFDLAVAGSYRPVALPVPSRQAVTGDFQVAYEGEPRTGSTQPLFMSVTTQGRPARLQPYLGAFGHLVVVREGDVGYVHVHPEKHVVDGKVKFWLAAPGPGRYRMFFDFQVAGKVHTAEWTAIVK